MTDKTTVDVLREARELITPEERWTQDTFARDAGGKKVFCQSQKAVCWCMFGAVEYVERETCGPAWNFLFDHIEMGSAFNDTHTHAEVLVAFDRAIELAEQEQA